MSDLAVPLLMIWCFAAGAIVQRMLLLSSRKVHNEGVTVRGDRREQSVSFELDKMGFRYRIDAEDASKLGAMLIGAAMFAKGEARKDQTP